MLLTKMDFIDPIRQEFGAIETIPFDPIKVSNEF